MRLLPVVALSLITTTVALSGDTAPDKMVAYRHTVMEGLGKHMKASSMIVKGEVGRPTDLVAHAIALHEASTFLTQLFPAGTGPDKLPSDSKPEIWTKWADFEKAAKAFEEESGKLVEVARAGDAAATAAQFGKVGKTCGTCHDSFKVDDE